MLKLILRSRKVRQLLTSLVASTIAMILGRWIGTDAAREIANHAAALIVVIGVILALGTAIEDAGTKASGRDPEPPPEPKRKSGAQRLRNWARKLRGK